MTICSPAGPVAPSAESPGLRARKKQEKVTAILEAARHLFTTKGYESTTLREVAQRADVGFGTVFSYSKDKSGLLCMLIVEDLRHMPPAFSAEIGPAGILDQLTDSLMEIYRFWAKSPDLSRVVLPQMEFPQLNPFATVIKERREQTKSELRAWLEEGQRCQRLRPDIDAAQAAETIFAIFTSCLREWIGSDPLVLEDARARLHHLLALPLAAIRRDDIQMPSAAAKPAPIAPRRRF